MNKNFGCSLACCTVVVGLVGMSCFVLGYFYRDSQKIDPPLPQVNSPIRFKRAAPASAHPF